MAGVGLATTICNLSVVRIRQDSSGGFHRKSLNSLTQKIIKISG
jgi:hypothetical protein